MNTAYVSVTCVKSTKHAQFKGVIFHVTYEAHMSLTTLRQGTHASVLQLCSEKNATFMF